MHRSLCFDFPVARLRSLHHLRESLSGHAKVPLYRAPLLSHWLPAIPRRQYAHAHAAVGLPPDRRGNAPRGAATPLQATFTAPGERCAPTNTGGREGATYPSLTQPRRPAPWLSHRWTVAAGARPAKLQSPSQFLIHHFLIHPKVSVSRSHNNSSERQKDSDSIRL